MKAALSRARARRVVAVAAVLAGLALAGCGSGGGGDDGTSSRAGNSGPASQRVTIVGGSSLRFAPMTSSTVTGDPGGTQTSFTVTFRHPGKYQFHCQYHASAGMTGVFLVS